ncbi:glycosyltransferase [Curtobacterium sp. PsM8]|uniref:glycosyltransferase n=1 Tax=Curtobacterium sp. PsM8 TaxID=3030532 RepID=UPI00263A985D|nr:glycosyltransferase [Curtobacterium sp. PsM8]MDN4646986.1 glycosyltransferase [Curtobacterium sp. PsM8]
MNPDPAVRPTLLVAASTFPAEPGDGTPGFVLDLALALADEYRVVVVAPMTRGARAHQRIGDVEVRRYGYFPARWRDLADGAIVDNLKADRTRWLQVPFFFGAMAAALVREQRRSRPDVALLHWIIPQGAVGRLVLGRLPRVVTTLGGDLYALRHPVLQAVKRSVVRSAASVTCMSTDMARELAALGARPEQVHVVPMGVDEAPIAAATARETRVAGRVLFVGRLVEKKGAVVLLDALERVTVAPTEVVVVGDGPLRRPLEARAGSGVSFVGARGKDALAAEYARASIALYPSVPAANGDRDGLPVALLEAMSAGCAVIASAVPGIVDVVEDGVNGLLVEPGDAVALAAAMDRLLADPDLALQLGRAAAETASAYSVDAVAERYRTLLRAARG